MPASLRWTLLGATVLAFILVPFALVGAQADAWALATLDDLRRQPVAVAGLVIALLAVDVVAPVPSSVVSVIAGALLGFAGGALASFVGMTLGCGIGYALGRSGGRRGARRFLGRREAARLDAGWARWGDAFLVVSRPVPVLAEASVIAAGLSAMDRRRFAWLTGLGNAGVSVGYAAVGAWAPDAPSFAVAFVLALAIPGVAMFAARRLGRA